MQKLFLCLFFYVFAIPLSASERYKDISPLLKRSYLSECDCLKGLTRLPGDLSCSLRGELDKLGAELLSESTNANPRILFFGAGSLLNEATAVAAMVHKGIFPDIVLVDRDYANDSNIPAQRALNQFNTIIYKLYQVHGQVPYIISYYDLEVAMKELAKADEKLDAFFVIDSFYPTDHGQSEIKSFIEKAIYNSPSYSCSPLFFFLNRFTAGKWSSNSGEPAVLSIFQAEIANGVLTYSNLILESVHF